MIDKLIPIQAIDDIVHKYSAEVVSNCCGFAFGEDTDICPKCHEHADGVEAE